MYHIILDKIIVDINLFRVMVIISRIFLCGILIEFGSSVVVIIKQYILYSSLTCFDFVFIMVILNHVILCGNLTNIILFCFCVFPC